MDKQHLLERIDQLPLFAKKKVNVEENGQQFEQKDFAICEEQSTENICFVSPRYNLVQLRSSFKPFVEEFEDVDGHIAYYNGYAIMDLFPLSKDPYKDIYKEGNSRIGLVITNSVDKSSAIRIRFCVKYDKTHILTIPKSVAGFHRVHTSKNLLALTQGYLASINKVKATWKTIVAKFPKYEIGAQELKDMLVDLDLGDTISSYIRSQFYHSITSNKKFSLWDVFNSAINYTNGGKYLSEIHKRKKLDLITEKILTYSFNLNLAI